MLYYFGEGDESQCVEFSCDDVEDARYIIAALLMRSTARGFTEVVFGPTEGPQYQGSPSKAFDTINEYVN